MAKRKSTSRGRSTGHKGEVSRKAKPASKRGTPAMVTPPRRSAVPPTPAASARQNKPVRVTANPPAKPGKLAPAAAKRRRAMETQPPTVQNETNFPDRPPMDPVEVLAPTPVNSDSGMPPINSPTHELTQTASAPTTQEPLPPEYTPTASASPVPDVSNLVTTDLPGSHEPHTDAAEAASDQRDRTRHETNGRHAQEQSAESDRAGTSTERVDTTSARDRTDSPVAQPQQSALAQNLDRPSSRSVRDDLGEAPVTPPQEPVHAPSPPLLFEVAWEVCWQLGGIYTVLRSKANAMTARWGDRYCLIGPYNPATAALEFEERPTEGVIRDVLDRLRDAGMSCHYGRWLIAGRPRVILLDHRARYGRLGEDKYLFWKDHGINIPDGDGEVNDVVAFGFAVAEFFRVISELKGDQPILAHFHEWMGGAAVPRIAHMRLPVTTVFTTHATLLGRYLAGDNPNFYDHLPFFNGDELAAKYQILPRHQIEKAAAHASVVFTTVSEVTNVETTHLLGRPADVILPNGLNLTRFHALHEFQNLHAQFKERINQFVMGHFFPSYTFDLDRTLYFFTSGRYEYKNKGMDVFIEAMHRLNERLRGVPDAPTIVTFIITKAATRHFNVEALRSQAQFREMQNTCAEQERMMGKRLLMSALTGRLPALSDLITPDASVKLKRAMHAWRSARQPLVVTHDLADDAGDPVLQHIRSRNLFNSADDPVKIVFHPQFLSATSPLINLDYDSFVRGCHLGVFPSYYEPWGYTPLEANALGVPAVTSDLSGFGTYVQQHIPGHDENGIFVLKRRNRSFEDAVEDLVAYFLDFCSLNRRQRIELRNRVERLSDMFDWEKLVRHYHEAHDLALERTLGRRPGKFEIRVV